MSNKPLKYGIIATILLLTGSIFFLSKDYPEVSNTSGLPVISGTQTSEAFANQSPLQTEEEKALCKQKCTGKVTRNSIARKSD